jgi:hypothetical protein
MIYKLVGFYKNSHNLDYIEQLFTEIKKRHSSITQSEIYNYQSSKVAELNITNFPCILLYKNDTLHRKLESKLTIKESLEKLRL